MPELAAPELVDHRCWEALGVPAWHNRATLDGLGVRPCTQGLHAPGPFFLHLARMS